MFNITLLILCLFLTACDTIFGKKEKIPLPGERHRVLMISEEVIPDSQARHIPVHIPDALNIIEWPMAGGNARHAMPPGQISSKIQKVWERDIGAGAITSLRTFSTNPLSLFESGSYRLLNGPIASDRIVFTVDAEGLVSATNLQSGKEVWQTETIPFDQRAQPFGGGLAFEKHKIYVTTANAEVVALDARNGTILWRSSTVGPIRTAPTVKDGRVFVITINNQLETFDANTGKLLWTHTGMIESAGLLGGASPAVHEGVIVVPYSSGEVFALRVENGYPLWSESLGSSQRLDSVSALSHIKARPIIDRNLVFLVGHGGRMCALDFRNGKTVWAKEFGGVRTPAIAGNFIFMITNENHLVCLKRETGQVIWVQELPLYIDKLKPEDKIIWTGPLLANNQLIVAGSQGKGLIFMTDKGTKSSEFDLPGATSLSPILVNKTLLFLTDAAILAAYR